MRRPGIWVANGAPSDPQKMVGWRPGALTCFYDYLGLNRVKAYKDQEPDAPIIVRFQHPQNWWMDPSVSAANLAAEVVSKWSDLKDLSPYVYFANELNLHWENGDPSPANQWKYETADHYEQVAQWVLTVADRIKQRIPDMFLVTPPYAYGHHEDGAPDDAGNVTEGWAGYDFLAPTIASHFDKRVTGHFYWGDATGCIPDRLYDPVLSSWHAFRWRRVLNLFRARYSMPDAQMIIDEAGNFAAEDPSFTAQVVYYSEQVLSDPRVLALTYFLWEDPTCSPGNIRNSWVQRRPGPDLDRHLSILTAMSDVSTDDTIRVLAEDGVIMTLPVKTYLRGVVPAEMPALWLQEAVYAQVVWAYSVALARKADPRSPFYDVTNIDQIYNPVLEHANSNAAIDALYGTHIEKDGIDQYAYYVSKCGRLDCPYCKGEPGHKTENNPSGVWPGRACQYGARTMALAGKGWREIALAYYGEGVVLCDHNVNDPSEPGDDDGGEEPPGGGDPVWDSRLNAYSEANGKVTGVKCIVEPHDTIRTKFGNPVLPVGGWYWKCTSGVFFDEAQAQGRHEITASVVDENGAPYPGSVWYAYPSDRMGQASWSGAFDNGAAHSGDVFAYPTGQGSIAMGANNFDPNSGKIGPYIIGVFSPAESGGIVASELVFGMGMPYNRHVSFSFVFQRTKLGATPEPTPGGTGCNLAAALQALLKKG